MVVEAMGGIEPARSLILEAIRLGKPVVTANKELLAAHGGELFDAADAAGVDLRFEAAVGGAIPIVAPLKESLAGDRVRRLLGIVNGTTNYVLWRMASTGAGYAEALAEATELGYAEPTRAPTSRASTPPPSAPSWPAWPSTPGWWPATSTARASPT